MHFYAFQSAPIMTSSQTVIYKLYSAKFEDEQDAVQSRGVYLEHLAPYILQYPWHFTRFNLQLSTHTGTS